MIHRLLTRIGWFRPSGERLLHQELTSIELTLALRNQEIVNLYKEMDRLRDSRDEVKFKLDQFSARKYKRMSLARSSAF